MDIGQDVRALREERCGEWGTRGEMLRCGGEPVYGLAGVGGAALRAELRSARNDELGMMNCEWMG